MKINRCGQGAILSNADYAKIRKVLVNERHLLLIDIAQFTGERWGAIVQLRVLDAFDEENNVRSHITFRPETRKANPAGDRTTRQVPIHSELQESLERTRVRSNQVWLFENPTKTGPITLRAADLMLRATLSRARLSNKGICTHSTRRTFITQLYEQGIDLHTIQKLTGHQDLKSLIRYIEFDPDRAVKAITLL